MYAICTRINFFYAQSLQLVVIWAIWERTLESNLVDIEILVIQEIFIKEDHWYDTCLLLVVVQLVENYFVKYSCIINNWGRVYDYYRGL